MYYIMSIIKREVTEEHIMVDQVLRKPTEEYLLAWQRFCNGASIYCLQGKETRRLEMLKEEEKKT